MKNNSFWTLIVSLSLAGSAFGLNIGDKAPDTTVKMKNVDGKEMSIADVAGKNGTLVVFTCNHCPFAQAWQTRIAAICNSGKDKGVGVIAINSNDPTDYPEDGYAEMQKRDTIVPGERCISDESREDRQQITSGRNRCEVFPDLRPNSFAFELPVEKPKRYGDSGEANQRPEKIENALHRSPDNP